MWRGRWYTLAVNLQQILSKYSTIKFIMLCADIAPSGVRLTDVVFRPTLDEIKIYTQLLSILVGRVTCNESDCTINQR